MGQGSSTHKPKHKKELALNQLAKTEAAKTREKLRDRLTRSTGSLPNRDQFDSEFDVPMDEDSLKTVLTRMGVVFKDDEDEEGTNAGLMHELNSESVIKIFCTQQEPDYSMPWQTLDVGDARGSGVLIEGGLILTAAHVISQHTYVEIQKSTDAKKVPAKVLYICDDADLALLEPLEDKHFLKGLKQVVIGSMPKRSDRIYVCGYPIGGEELSVTTGVVSRIELQPYSHSLRQLLAVTVDAAINSGNSGGPVFNTKGELAGIAFQALEGAENVGHIIPPPIIQHFVKGVEKYGSNYKGFPELGIVAQILENPVLRKHYKMKDDQTGILICKVSYGNSGYGTLKENDVILSIDGFQVANNGTITFEDKMRGEYQLAIHRHHIGDKVPIKVWRDGAEHDLQVEMVPVRELAPVSQHIHRPPYFLYNGLLFQPLSIDLLRHYFAGSMMAAPQELLYMVTVAGTPTKKRHEVIVMTRVFRDDINTGYEDMSFSIIQSVNGAEIKDLRDFVTKVEACAANEMVVLVTSQNAKMVLPSKETDESKDAIKRILKRYNVTKDRHLQKVPHHTAQGVEKESKEKEKEPVAGGDDKDKKKEKQ